MKTRLALPVAVIAFIACAAYNSAAQQPSERLIRRLPVEKDEPIEITDVKVNGQSVSLDKRFTADDDWLGSLAISVKSKSDKLILYASVRLQFPRPEGSGRVSIFQMSHGNAALRMRAPTAQEQTIGIAPGEIAEIKLSPQEFTDLRNFLSGTQYPYSIEKVDLSIDSIILQDDTMWYAGAIARRDPKDASRWINSQYSRRPSNER